MGIRNAINNFIENFERGFTPLNYVLLNKERILHNYAHIQKNANKEVWPVLKGNAYGHGLREVAKIIHEVSPRYVVVDSYFEALQIWNVAPKQEVLLIGITNPVNFKNMSLKKCAVVVYDKETITALGVSGQHVRVHIKVNTGMNRQGVEVEEVDEYVALIKKNSNLKFEGICTHFADADGETDVFTHEQEKKFTDILNKLENSKMLPQFIHAGATAGSVKTTDSRINAVRLGIGLYGFSTVGEHDAYSVQFQELKPVMSFVSTLIKIREIKSGDAVGYNNTFIAKRPMKIGLIPVGYYEVLDRRLSSNGCVKIHGEYAPIIGRVSMNLTTVDVSGIAVKAWDVVEVISDEHTDKNSVMSIAKKCTTIPYEVLTGVNQTTRRVVV